MKFLRYTFYLLLILVLVITFVLLWPKGDLKTQMADSHVPAVGYALIEEGEVVEWQVLGELESGVPAPQHTIFNVASVTKPVFAVTVLSLIDKGALGLDEPLYPYWVDPEVAGDPRHKLLTARIILSHQTGFPNWRWNTPDGKLAFAFDPGAEYGYSGEGMEYLRKAIEKKLNASWPALADSLIFSPLGMKDSRLVWDEEMEEAPFAKWHNGEGELYDTFKRTHAVASDDLLTTVEDYAKFAIYVMNGVGLSEELWKEMGTNQLATDGDRVSGLGWELILGLPQDEYGLVHGGSDMGVKSRVAILPKSKRAFIMFTNGDKGQRLIDRWMVKRFDPKGELISRMYAPFFWRIIYLPF
ncbi:MAG: serine hydrolase domain-containing protein [Bacteroidota bacterium]